MDKGMFVLLIIILSLILRCIYLQTVINILNEKLKEAWKTILDRRED